MKGLLVGREISPNPVLEESGADAHDGYKFGLYSLLKKE
jgi:hypothetical protein